MPDTYKVNRRRFLGLGAAGLLTGCDFTLRDGLKNTCQPALSPNLRDHPLVLAAWRGLDPAKVWDVHCHAMGAGDSGTGPWMNSAIAVRAAPVLS